MVGAGLDLSETWAAMRDGTIVLNGGMAHFDRGWDGMRWTGEAL